MKNIVILSLFLCTAVLSAHPAQAREERKAGLRAVQTVSDEEIQYIETGITDQGRRDLYTSAQADTYCIVWFDFETMDWQGWTRRDNTAQEDTFFHVDDFDGLGGGTYGRLMPIEGTRSMWCGSRPGYDEYLCGWNSAPGYGNSWEQYLVTDPFPFTGTLTLSYHGVFDSEPEYDNTYVEYDAGGSWVEVIGYDGVVDTVASHELLLAQAATKLRFHFSSDGGWSDEDGLWESDGAAIIDSITISDNGGFIDYEDFESWPVGSTDYTGALWHARPREGYGLYSGLAHGLIQDKDPCGQNLGTQIVFFIGSEYPSTDYPGLYDTPFCKGPGGIEWPCQKESVISPVIDMTKFSTNCNSNQDADIPPEDLPKLGGAYLRFTVYRDLPIPNLVFYNWGLQNVIAGCPGSWRKRTSVYYGPDRDYIHVTQQVGDLIGPHPIRIRLDIRDMCDVWYEIYGYCADHTPSPWFDNVRIQRYDMSGPQWSYRDLDLFQDNFPGVEFDLESYVRADAANDLRPNDDPVIDPGDSITVDCTSPLGGGLDTTPDGRPKIFMHVRCTYIGDPLSPKPDLYGPSLEGSYGTYYGDDGSTWTIIQGYNARMGSGNYLDDRYMFDLNDSLFTRGYEISYYFEAFDHAGKSSTLPEFAGEGAFFEWTCLPTLASDILFVDDFHGRGTMIGYVQNYWDPSFKAVFPNIFPGNRQADRYDVNSPSSRVSNGPGSRAKNYHMKTAYNKVIWDSGNLGSGTITDGSNESDKSNDAQMLVDWMQFSEHDVGLWVCGDGIAADLDALYSSVSLELMINWCGVEFVHDSYYDLTGGRIAGGVVNPKVIADNNPGNPLWHTTWGDSFYVFGGCPIVNSFDVLEKAGNGEYALRYPDFQGLPYYAGIYANNINNGGYDVKTMWFGFSFMYIRDCEGDNGLLMRYSVVRDVFCWFLNPVNSDITDSDRVPTVYSLSQNFPNPFNPATTIKFAVREKGLVTLNIYNVAGQLVRTLVDEVRDAGVYDVTWDGSNNDDIKVASGVYFYKMETKAFRETKKMILLR